MAGYGMQSHAMFNFQESMGTVYTDSLQAIAITEESIVDGIEQLIEAGMYSRFGESPYHEGFQTVEGDITQEASPISLGYYLKSIFGSVTTTSDTGIQSHVFKTPTADFDGLIATPPLTIEVYRDIGSAAVYYDLAGNTFALNVANGELLTATLGVLGGKFSKQAASSPTFPTASPFKWDQASISFDGANVLDIQDLTWNVNNNLENRWTLQNTNTPYKTKRTAQQQIELSGTFIFQQHSYWDAFLNQDEKSMILYFASAQSPNSLKIDMPLVRFKSFDPVIAGAGIIEAAFTAGAMFSASSNTAVEITLVNTFVGY